jgi:hypothetical protein
MEVTNGGTTFIGLSMGTDFLLLLKGGYMPWEDIGSCGNGQLPNDMEWNMYCYSMALSYLKFVIGDPPAGCDLGIMWNEHELGEYPSVGVWWGPPQMDIPQEYISRCEFALEKFDDSIAWSEIEPDAIDEELNELGLSPDQKVNTNNEPPTPREFEGRQ